jgi:amino acid adenylation domain-containing protein
MTTDTEHRPHAETGGPTPDPALLPLSYGQEQLWFLEQLSPGESAYNLVGALRLRGPLDTAVLGAALDLVVARHAALRTVVGVHDGAPYQIVREPAGAGLRTVDLGGLPQAEREEALQAALAELAGAPFDLEEGPLHRYVLYRLAEDEHVLCQGFHHIVTDGWSAGVLNAEVSAAYTALVAGHEPDLPPVESDYPQYAAEQRIRLSGEALEEELAFWQEKLAKLPTLELPTDRPRPPEGVHSGEMLEAVFDPRAYEAARALAEQHEVSLFMVLAAAYTAVLAAYSGQEDIPVGVPMLGRPDPDLEEVVGLFINMTVMRADLSGDPSFATLLERIADANMDLYEHQEVPFNLVVDRVQPARDPSRNPLFQVTTQLLTGSTSGDDLDLHGLTAESVSLPTPTAQFDITLNFVDHGKTLGVAMVYATALFDRWRMQALVGHIETLIVAAAADPGLRLSQMSLLSAEERAQLLAVGDGGAAEYFQDPLHVMVARHAAATPDAVALVCKGVELTYAEFDRRADRLARYLRGRGLRAGQVVAVVIDRDLDAYVALLGILKAGAAFTVLDPKLPAGRLDFMIRDTAAPLVLTRSALADRLPEAGDWSPVLLDTQWDEIEAVPADEPLEEWATRESLAYVLYTSGSTGTPKGVMIRHRGVSLFADGYRRTFGFGPQDRLLQLPSLTFDMSQGEFWTGFLVGATVVAASPDEALSPEALAALMRDQRVTYAGLNPAMLSVIDAEPYPALKYIMGGAEVLPPELVNKWNVPGRTFVNLYGPTETAIACTEYPCEHVVWQTSPPIGRPHINRQMYVVDRFNNLVPRGVAGELLIGGPDDAGLADGYLNQPELTAEKFPQDPFHPGRRVYRSGDLVRWNKDLQIEFIGRVDHQVKLRGLRIELGEIESALVAHASVARSVVLMRPDRQGDNRLIGYVTAAPGQVPDPVALQAHLAAQLPEYMVPAAWVVIDEFPLSSGWKIDRKALPDPVEDDAAGGDYLAPRTPTEEKVAAIFAEVLGRERVGALDSFFDAGGNSLQAMRAVSRINKGFGIKISIRLLYGSTTVAAVSAAVDERTAGRSAGV